MHINLRVVRVRSQSLVITTHTYVPCQYKILKHDTSVKNQHYFKSEETKKKSKNTFVYVHMVSMAE